MLTLADLKFAVFEAGSLWPYTWKRTREEAECVALERSQGTGKLHLVESEDEYQARHDAHFLGTFPLQEITEDFYNEMLNVLPPMYRQGALGFFMCEFTAGTITSQFARYEGKPYGAAVDICNAETWITPEKIKALPVAEPANMVSKRKRGRMMGANYQRVIPRDLFNEADLLKCLGRLYLLTEYRPSVRLLHSGSAFNIMQNESDGSIYCDNLSVIIGSRVFDHMRPLNSREPWPLWLRLRSDPDAEEFRAFDDGGAMSDELLELLG